MPRRTLFQSLLLTTLVSLTSLPSLLAAPTPFPKGGGGHGGGGGGGGGHGSGSGGSGGGGGSGGSGSGDNKPLSKGEIAGIIIGVFFGSILVFGVAFICTNIDWCIKKEYEFYDWRARQKAKKEGKERGYQVQESPEEGEAKEWDGDSSSDGGEVVTDANESEGEDEYTDAPTEAGAEDEAGLKVPVQVYEDSVSEITQVDAAEDEGQTYINAPEVRDQSGSWRDRWVGKWTRMRSDSSERIAS